MFDTARTGRGLSIRLDELTKVYPGQREPAVDRVTMEIPAGQTTMFVGPSGCGKTTTMKIINRLIEPSSGTVSIDGQNVLGLDPNELRRHIGYVVQQIGLFPHMTIAQNIGLVPKLLGWSRAKVSSRVDELLEMTGLDPASFRARYPRQLSGGQQQRVGVARALAADPPVLLMDEPFGATDPITRERLQTEFRRLQRELGKTVVFVTHDFEEALKLGDRIAVLADRSRIVQYDTPARLLAAPADDYVRSFIGSAPYLKQLALATVADVKLGPTPEAPNSLPTVDGSASLRDVMDLILQRGGAPVTVVDEAGAVTGTLAFTDVCRALSAQEETRVG
ncbi:MULTISPECIES: ATP-binding cassette domain-containing protein [unclassified Streptomyces]|uniref:ABC transporter ATP-binding protein n=1 Tax=unclassified Streptomyces TaxID=2593676 RepID=UPI002DD8A79F|nr:ATP-binding cassette domain-containing protein [Streptomyces sp. NBC_00243]WRZ17598.1 ATP-binding cassette domain-containing protein [Streptomyces sp. NBC_00243]